MKRKKQKEKIFEGPKQHPTIHPKLHNLLQEMLSYPAHTERKVSKAILQRSLVAKAACTTTAKGRTKLAYC